MVKSRYTALQVASVMSIALFLQGMLLWKIIGGNIMEGSRGLAVGLFVIVLNLAMAAKNGFKVTRMTAVLCLILVASTALLFLYTASHARSAYGIWKAQGFLLFILMPCLFILFNFRNRPTSLLLFYRVLMVLTAIPLILPLTLSQSLGGWGMRWLLHSLGYNIIGISRSLGIGSILALSFALSSRIRVAIPRMILLLLLLYGQVALSERGPMLALAVALVVVSFLRFSERQSSLKMLIVKTLVLVLITLMVISALSYVVMLRAEVGHQELRISIYKEGLTDFVESPIFGVGAGNFSYDTGTIGKRQYVHNVVFEALVETGIVGFLVIGSFFFLAWRGRVPRDQQTPEIRLLADISLGLLTFSVTTAMFSGDIPTNNFIWVSQALLFTAWSCSRPAAGERETHVQA